MVDPLLVVLDWDVDEPGRVRFFDAHSRAEIKPSRWKIFWAGEDNVSGFLSVKTRRGERSFEFRAIPGFIRTSVLD